MPAPLPDDLASTATGLPGFSTWRAVYFVVLGVFALWVILLVALPRLFS